MSILDTFSEQRPRELRGADDMGNPPYIWLVSLIAAFGGFLFGYDTVDIAGTISMVTREFGLSAPMVGWFVSSGLVGCLLGVLIGGRLCDRVGRKGTMIVSAVLLIAGALGCGFAPDLFWIITCRIVGGIGVGVTSIASPLYISEVAPPRYRGRLVSLFQLAITIGIVAAMLVNAALLRYALGLAEEPGEGLWHWVIVKQTWRAMFLGQVVPGLVFLVGTLLIVESPRWLALRGRLERARRVLERLRAAPQIAKAELEAIANDLHRPNVTGRGWTFRGLRKPLFLGIFLTVFSELSGITVVMYYGPVILEHAGLSAGSSLNGDAFIGIVLAVFTLIATFVVDRVGRRRLLLSGVAGACLTFVATGIYFAGGANNGVLATFLLCVFVAFFAYSIGPIKFIVISEIFPTNARARAMGLATVAMWLTDILLNQIFPSIRENFGVSVIFFGCAALLAIQFIVVAVAMPETKGLALEDMMSVWEGAKKGRSHTR